MVPKDAIYTVAGLTKMFVIRDGRAVEQQDQSRARNRMAGWKCRASGRSRENGCRRAR